MAVTINASTTSGLQISSDTSGAIKLQKNGTDVLVANTSGTITVPDATDTLVGKATTDTLTNKTVTALKLSAGTASANTAPLEFASGTNLTTPEAGAVEYDGTIATITPSTSFGRAAIPLTVYASGTGTALGTNTEATLAALLPSANDTITLPIGTYFLDTTYSVTRGASTTTATTRINILGSGAAVGTFSGVAVSFIAAAGTMSSYFFDAVNINTSNVVSATNATSAGFYNVTFRGIMKITTAGTIVPQYNLSANINGAGTVSKVYYFTLQQLDTQSAAAFGPAGCGWG